MFSIFQNWSQILTALIATISMMILGTNIGWTSPMIPQLLSSNSSLQVSSSDAGWITSFLMLGAFPGCILAGLIVDKIGRKTSLLLANIPLLLGWILVLIAWKPYILFIARFISGIGMGSVYVLCPIYLGEIADKNIRGTLGSFMKLMMNFGEPYGHAIGPYVTYKIMGYSCAAIPIIFFITFILMPESPYYLLVKNRKSDAIKSLRKLRNYRDDDKLIEELEQINETVIKDMANKGHFWDLFRTSGNKKAVVICFGLQLILQFSGLGAIESYTQKIMGEAEIKLSPSMVVIILNILQTAAGIIAATLVDKIGRRPLLINTTFIAGITLSISGIFCYLKNQTKLDMKPYGYILVTSIIFYALIIALGLSPLAYMMLGELFSTDIKSFAVSLTNIWSCFLAFIVAKLFQVISDSLGIEISFAWFAISCFIGVVFIVFYVPETKGKSFADIQNELNFKTEKSKVEFS